MLIGGDHPRDGERFERLCLVFDVLDRKPDHGELVGDLVERLGRIEVLLEPGEGELHGAAPRPPSTSIKRNRSHTSSMRSANLPRRSK